MRDLQFEQGRLPVANLNRQTVRAQSEDSEDEEIQAQHDGTQPTSAWMQLQRAHGNRFVQRVVDLMRSEDGEGDIDPEIERTIHGARGGGHALDSGVRARMEPAFKADFGGVRVHTDSRADTLNRSLRARAFTTGQDIFFKQGEYRPGSSSGRELLAHELTHVVQQNGNGVQTKLTLGRPGDKYEQEADSMAQAVLEKEHQGLQRQVEEEEEEA
ncbi:MAG: DUF4157 domain-containing protein [Caldilineaceae bacterium]|nr:DUF4157 domain-containing protein [Caldilineaceae bacterium]